MLPTQLSGSAIVALKLKPKKTAACFQCRTTARPLLTVFLHPQNNMAWKYSPPAKFTPSIRISFLICGLHREQCRPMLLFVLQVDIRKLAATILLQEPGTG